MISVTRMRYSSMTRTDLYASESMLRLLALEILYRIETCSLPFCRVRLILVVLLARNPFGMDCMATNA